MSMIITTFDAGYGRQGIISVEQTECDVCHKTVPCIVIDSSEKEYKAGAICKKCIDGAFAANARAFSLTARKDGAG